jgi:hypothetical protein
MGRGELQLREPCGRLWMVGDITACRNAQDSQARCQAARERKKFLLARDDQVWLLS